MDPRVVALASVVPGLGFALERKYRQAVLSVLVIVGLLGIFLFTPVDWQFVGQLSCTFLVLVWVGQGYLAFDGARRERRLQNGDTAAPKPSLPPSPAPAHLSRTQRLTYQVRQFLEQQTLPGEHLSEVLQGTAMPPTRSHILFGAAAFYAMKQYDVGLSQDGLLLLHLDFWGRPAEVTRVARSKIKSANFRKGRLNGRLEIQVEGSAPLRLTIPVFHREAAQAIADELSIGAG